MSTNAGCSVCCSQDAVALFQHNMRSLQALGYSHADSLNALRVNGGNLELAIDFLTAATR